MVWRYLRPGREERIIVVLAAVSLLAVTLGVAALVVVMSVMGGFREQMTETITSLSGHIVVTGKNGALPDWRRTAAALRRIDGVVEVTPAVTRISLANAEGYVAPIVIRGLPREDVMANARLRESVFEGDLASLFRSEETVAIGSGLAGQLRLRVGSSISVLRRLPDLDEGTPPEFVDYSVGAIYDLAALEREGSAVLMSIEGAQHFLGGGDSATSIQVRLADPEQAALIQPQIAQLIGERGTVRDWRELNAALYGALGVERVAMFTILSLTTLIAAFNMLAALVMLVGAKRSDIAALRTMGAGRGAILRLFVTIGMIIGSAGTLFGILFGVLVVWLRGPLSAAVNLAVAPSASDMVRTVAPVLPAKLDPWELLAIAGVTLILAAVATLYPALNAARTDPVRVLRSG